jgi:hypothetical protein
MRTRTGVALAAAAGLIGAAAVGVPAVLAADDDRPDEGRFGMMWSDDAPRWDDERGFGRMGGWMHGGGRGGWGGMGPGLGAAGPCGWGEGEPAGKLTADQKDDLADFAEREKLAQDLYTDFADAAGDPRLSMLAWSESHHLRTLQAMLERYDVEDPTEGNGPGEFTDEAVAADYDAMLEDGSGSQEAALEVSRDLEQGFVDTLGDAAEQLEDSAPDVARAYEHLAFASARHLEVLSD